MSYTPYTPPTGTVPPTSTTYPYSAYQTPYPGTYAYQNPYATGVTSYAWPYPYGYMAQHPQAAQLQRAQTQLAAPIRTAPATPTVSTPAPTAAAQTTTTAQVATVPTAPVTATTTTTQAAPVVATPAAPQRTATTTFSTYTPAYAPRETTIPTSASNQNLGAVGGRRRQSNLRGLFTKDLRSLMYGFGDDRNPSNDTVNVMEEILIEYITDVCQVAGANSKRARLSVEDLRKALSRPADAKKLARLEELIFMQEDIKRARGMFDESDSIQNSTKF
ncbi:hypothetical protein CC1G_01391 [Coprinopsis cinerea okayama7|uniref:Transcription initiation factor TFIID subunit 13 n=1 Tax=Coprinopsis cinerea (strain Okayama-7 / 130 / ATCC MYA-4618 / FGSC 9003) TaxID=240176 RepID=A8NYN8_COPC7|nr:hypothetical protein CC1G_01391 [Coprinopsis cinerea okayama7\|eukprot:XP_001837479.2 hypothetical protein CC1G_01391 [Coprinopsis cinerea okayama7\